jgi:hypothetical protein
MPQRSFTMNKHREETLCLRDLAPADDEVQGYMSGAEAFGSALVFGIVGAPCYLIAAALTYASQGSTGPHYGSGSGGGVRG